MRRGDRSSGSSRARRRSGSATGGNREAARQSPGASAAAGEDEAPRLARRVAASRAGAGSGRAGRSTRGPSPRRARGGAGASAQRAHGARGAANWKNTSIVASVASGSTSPLSSSPVTASGVRPGRHVDVDVEPALLGKRQVRERARDVGSRERIAALVRLAAQRDGDAHDARLRMEAPAGDVHASRRQRRVARAIRRSLGAARTRRRSCAGRARRLARHRVRRTSDDVVLARRQR